MWKQLISDGILLHLLKYEQTKQQTYINPSFAAFVAHRDALQEIKSFFFLQIKMYVSMG